MGDSSTKVGKGQTGIQVNSDILPNILDNYDLPTYHFRLYMMSPGAVLRREYQGPNSDKERVVVAESGVSTSSIDDVTITTTGSISKQAGTGVATRFSFTLQEPFGATLLDQIQRGARFLGIQNFQKFPMFLELSFKARNVGGDTDFGTRVTEKDSIFNTDDPLKGMVWTWPIQLTGMAMNVTTGGTTYALEAAGYAEHAYTNQSSDLEKTISITTDSVGDFFTQLQDELNEREIEKKESSGYVAPDRYGFYIDADIYDEKIVPDSVEERQNRAAAYEEGKDGKLTFTFQPGISIEKIIKNVLSLTSYYQKKSKGTDDPDAIGDDKKGEEAIYPTLWRTIADAQIGIYDNVRNDYQRSYKYLIIPYEVPTLQTPSNITANQSSKQRIDAHKRKGLIKKVYNYIYTGLNDQVFDFELNFNFNWYIALPIQGGITTVASRAESKGKQTEQQKSDTEKLAEGINNAKDFFASPIGFTPMSFIEDLLNGSISGFAPFETAQNAVTDASLQVSDIIGDATAATEAATATVQSGMPTVPNSVGGIIQPPQIPTVINPALGILNGAGTLVQRLTSSTRLPRVSTGANSNITNKAQQNLRSLDIQVDDITEDDIDGILATIQESESGRNSLDGQDYAASAGQTLLSAMFEQAESPVSRDLINIDLNIKGDPYWIEPAPHKLGTAPPSIFRRLMANRGANPDADNLTATSTTPQSTDADEVLTANTAQEETLMVFRSFTPQEFDPDTGITPAGKKSTNVINGVYGVKMVVHNFNRGEFTQTLKGIRDININLRNVDLFENLQDQPEDSGEDSTTPRSDISTPSDEAGGIDLSQNPLGTYTGSNEPLDIYNLNDTDPNVPTDVFGRPLQRGGN